MRLAITTDYPHCGVLLPSTSLFCQPQAAAVRAQENEIGTLDRFQKDIEASMAYPGYSAGFFGAIQKQNEVTLGNNPRQFLLSAHVVGIKVRSVYLWRPERKMSICVGAKEYLMPLAVRPHRTDDLPMTSNRIANCIGKFLLQHPDLSSAPNSR